MTARDLNFVRVPRPFVGHLRHCRALFARLEALVSVAVSVGPIGSISLLSYSSDCPSAALSLERALIMRIVTQSPTVGLGAALGFPLLPGLWPRAFLAFKFQAKFLSLR